MPFPANSNQYTKKIAALMELALIGKMIVDESLYLYDNSYLSLSLSTGKRSTILPPTFIPSLSSSRNAEK